jgi:hypothetical protein
MGFKSVSPAHTEALKHFENVAEWERRHQRFVRSPTNPAGLKLEASDKRTEVSLREFREWTFSSLAELVHVSGRTNDPICVAKD